jgi:hypothetical protein
VQEVDAVEILGCVEGFDRDALGSVPRILVEGRRGRRAESVLGEAA